MSIQQGLAPFILAAGFIAAGLLIVWVVNRKMDASQADRFGGIGHFLAVLGTFFGFQLRIPEYKHGNDSLPGPVLFSLMFGIYVSLYVLVSTYTQYRKNRDDAQLAQKLIKESVVGFLGSAFVFVLSIVWEFIQCST
ncbi:hypothetical protein [Papillibacter cinnamivorans]|uniref:Uncharacterized protein n=1 Tax=Papillibacter cinnamivorans DSM 12816 TaxID=1122930 RepID=A0A1W2CIP0_9FIRM|nr:hypothetical protein [Papillibacter cinnamivorans]SMC84498.1 hypothetical protein SAMN02745168_0018 [Papillibacter cinnamivorans DSM 12816]